MSTNTDQPLPGLDQPAQHVTELERAARRTLAALAAAGELDESKAVLCQLVLTLARAIDAGTRSGRASAVAMAAKELREALLMLYPVEPEGGKADEWDDFVRKLGDAATRDTA